MRPILPLLLCLSACGGPPALIGTWQFDVTVRVLTPSGVSEDKALAIPIKLVAGTKTAVAWQVGGCTMDLQVVGDIGTLPLPITPCTLMAVDDVPFASQTTGVQLGDVLIASLARFEVDRSMKPSQPNYTFRSNEEGLSAQIDYRIRPKSEPVDSLAGNTYSFKTTTGFGHRVP